MQPDRAEAGGDSAVTAESLGRTVEGLLAAQKALVRRPADEVLTVLDRVVARWLEPESSWRLRAEAVLADATGFSPAMLRRGLPLLLAPLRARSIRELLVEELGGLDRIDRDAEEGPKLIAHVLPGNIPALAATPICLSLAVKAAALVKPGSGDRWFPGLFARSIAEMDEPLGAAVAVCYWRGGTADAEKAAFARADVVEAAGSDDAIAHIRGRVAGRLIAHGSKISCAFLGHEIVTYARTLTRMVRQLAEDISLWDQQGCLSPQVVFIETSVSGTVERVADELAAALDALARELPPRRATLEEQAQIQRFRQQAEWNDASGGHGRLRAGEDLSWTLLLESEPRLEPTCLHRSVRLQPVSRAGQMAAALEAKRGFLEAVGLAVDPRRFDAVAESVRHAGAHRVCPVGQMQRPDLTWKPSGKPRVAGWFA